MKNQTGLKWHDKPTWVIILLIVFWPVGLYLMWKNDFWSKPVKWVITIVVAAAVYSYLGDDNKESSSAEINNSGIGTIEGTKRCLEGYDWVYPNANNLSSAFKFSADGTYNYSTKMFGGMSVWGTWSVSAPGKVHLNPTRSTEGIIPDGQTIIMSSCESLNVGSTSYSKL